MSITEKDWARLEDAARKLGAEHGKNAAGWYFDGNTSADTYRAVLAGIENGDPAVLDTFPAADFSGQWADGYSVGELWFDCGGPESPDVQSWGDVADEQELQGELADIYSDAFSEAVSDEIGRVARLQTEHSPTAKPRTPQVPAPWSPHGAEETNR